MTHPLTRRDLIAAVPAGAAMIDPALISPAMAQTPPDIVEDWFDPARSRTVPVRIRLPDPAQARGLAHPVIVSHGLGGSRDGLGYLGAAFAAAGFVAVHLQHHGSDSAIWRNGGDFRLGMAAAVLDVRNALDRLRDVVFALDTLATLPALRGRVDARRAAIAGHSFGAWTVTHMLGERLPGGAWGLTLPDPRLLAGVAISPVPPIGLPPNAVYGGIGAPIMHITGTNDTGMIEAATADDRLIPYRNIAAPGVLAVLDGAYHASFAGEPGGGARFNDPTYARRTADPATLFLRATMNHDAAARALLLRGTGLAAGDRLESHGFRDAAI